MTTKLSTMKLKKADRIARITLTRAAQLNVFNEWFVPELNQLLDDIEKDSDIKAVVIDAEGRAFSAGLDFQFCQTLLKQAKEFKEWVTSWVETLIRIQEFPLPVIAVVNDFCLAGGFELMLSCDLVFAANDAKIGDNTMNFGFLDASVFRLLLDRTGWQRSLELVTTGRQLSGKEAEQYGLALKAVDSTSLEREVEAFLSQLRNMSRPGLVACKKGLRGAGDIASRREAMRHGQFVQYEYFTSEKDPMDGLAAFLAKQRPKF